MIKQPQIPMTARDFHLALYEMLKPGGYIEQRFGADAVKFRDHEIGMMIIELIAGMAGVFSYAAGREAQETNVLTARETQSVVDAAAALGYSAQLPKAATIPIRIRFENYTGQLVIPEDFAFETDPTVGAQVLFELGTDVQKPEGETTVDATFTHGETIVEQSVFSSGNPRDRVELTDGPVARDSAVVLVDGVAWQEVRSFADTTPTSEVYRVVIVEHVPGERKYLVEFGDGTRGKYPPNGSTIQISYRKGGGTVGNVPASTVGVPLTTLTAPDGTTVVVTVEALDDGTGGIDEESIDAIRLNSVLEYFTNLRTVSRDDFALSARVDAGLARALTVTNEDEPTIAENTVFVFGVQSLDSVMSVSEADAAKQAMQDARPKSGTDRLVVAPAQFDDFTVHVEVRAYRVQGSLASIDADTKLITQSLMSLDGVIGVQENRPRYFLDIGQDVDQGPLESELFDIPNVKSVRVLLNNEHTPYRPGARNMPRPSTITYDIDFEG